ncbi:hypothetical protein AC482_00660 [miscellaneous Crenarchaeota group-15 archaeon DG-45]|uniref:Short-chain dehydrogenase n=1 Tax=miscellaneous Crenarchaeota group-15 archaeon DG-45 TaxID=1685127 RepID=A0A0M0BSU3_9ARCH|nr:MAG: hypothetical protein AC482_00660 [miscellaneous Crenarchaeota group-15 archaeon DG-45]
MGRLKDKVCIVTGVAEAEGIGFGIAKVFAREGATVVCVVRRPMVFDRVKELTEAGHKAIGFVADLSKADEVEGLVDEVLARFGRVDVLVNNAGGGEGVRGSLVDITEGGWDKVIDANLKTCMLCSRAVLPSMMERRKGKIVNISSVTGPKVTIPGSTPYSASKGAVSAFTRALALDVGEYGITVNAISPGYVETGAFPREGDRERIARSVPVKRLGRPEEVGYLALFLSTEESDYITGQEIVFDGGNIIQEFKIA